MSTVLRSHRPYAYVACGLLLGLAYAFLNTQTDEWAGGAGAQPFLAFHAFVDRVIPLVAGGLLGLAFHWIHLRSRLVREETLRADELRSRLRHVERDQAVWVVAASTLHELKNPLHAMGLLVDELGDIAVSGDPVAIAQQVGRVRLMMDRALVPLDALRELTRQGPQRRRLRPIGATAEDVVAALRPLATEAGVELRLEGDLDAALDVDSELVRIILDNLVANALEGDDARRAHRVVVRISQTDERVVLQVSDDGPGLPEARRKSVFEPLQTAKKSGLGLGLPIARALARSLGGELIATTIPGFATSFELALPIR